MINNHDESDCESVKLVSSSIALELVGNAHSYQIMILLTTVFQSILIGIVLFGLPLLLQPPHFNCKIIESPSIIQSSITQQIIQQCERIQHTNQKEIFDMMCVGSNVNGLDKTVNNLMFKLLIDDKKHIGSLFMDLKMFCSYNIYSNFNYMLVVGLIIGGWVYSSLIEKYGRTNMILSSIAMMSLSTMVGYFFTSLPFHSLFCLVLYCNISGYLVSMTTYIVEITSDNLRLVYPALMLVSILIGRMTVCFMIQYIVNWKTYYLIIGIASLVNFIFLYEKIIKSIRYLIVQKQYDQAKSMLDQMSIYNQRLTPDYKLKDEVDTINMQNHIAKLVDIQQQQIVSINHQHHILSPFYYQSLRLKSLLAFIVVVINSSALLIVEQSLSKFRQYQLIEGVVVGCYQVVGIGLGLYSLMGFRRREVIKNLFVIIGIVHMMSLFIIASNVDPEWISVRRSYSLVLLQTLNILLCWQLVFQLVYVSELFPTTLRHHSNAIFMICFSAGYVSSSLLELMFDGRPKRVLALLGVFQLMGLLFMSKYKETVTQGIIEQTDEHNNTVIKNKNFEMF